MGCVSKEISGDKGVNMQIGRIKRLYITYLFWKALGAEKHNSVMAVIHENGFGDVSSGYMSDKAIEDLRRARNPAGYDHEHRNM